MSEFHNDNSRPLFSPEDIDFLSSLDTDSLAQFDEPDERLGLKVKKFDIQPCRNDIYVPVVIERGQVISKYMESLDHSEELVDYLKTVVERSHSYFRSFVDTILRSPMTGEEKVSEITFAMTFADASQVPMNEKYNKQYQFNIHELKNNIRKVMDAAFEDDEIVKNYVEEQYNEKIRDFVLSYVQTH